MTDPNRQACLVLWVGSVAVVGLHWIAAALPERIWGGHHLAFLSSTAAVSLSAVAVLLLAFGLSRRVAEGLEVGLASWPLPPRATDALVLAGFGSLFLSLPVRHLLLGDAGLVHYEVRSGEALERADAPILQIAAWSHGLLRQIWEGWTADDTFTAGTSLCGAAYVASALRLAREVGASPVSRVFAFLCMTGVGTLLLFFGYPEHYAPVITGLGVVSMCLVAWNGCRGGWLVVGGMSAALTGLGHHLAAFALAPILVAALLHLRRNHRWSARRAALWGSGCTVALVALGGLAAGARPDLLLPLSPSAPYDAFSVPHALDAVNGWLLVVPLHGVILAAVLAGDGPARLGHDPVIASLAVFAAAGVVASFVVDPALGALDWDLMSLFSVPVAALCAACVARGLPVDAQARGLLAVGAGTFLHLSAWILVNHEPAAAVRMIEAMAARDPHHVGERRVKLGVKLEYGGYPEAAMRQYGTVLASDPDDGAALRNLGFLLYEHGRTEEALQLLARAVDLAASDFDVRTLRSVLSWHAGDEDTAVRLAATRLLEHPGDRRAIDLCRNFASAAAQERSRLLAEVALGTVQGAEPGMLRTLDRLRELAPGDPVVAEVARRVPGR